MADKNAKESNISDQTEISDDIEGNDKFKERELEESSSPFPTVKYSIDGPNISPSEIAQGEGQIPVSFTLEANWEAFAFSKDSCTGKNHFSDEREIPITPSKYVHVRLKCCDNEFAANPQ